ncbi:hypothetical protein DITRI_Ditri12bG0048900 [Diplodiscus trichospermus]
MPAENSTLVVRSICVRDMGTEMTPITRKEPSRTATPIRATTHSASNPIPIGSSTSITFQHASPTPADDRGETNADARGNGSNGPYEQKSMINENNNSDQARKQNTQETRAMAWDKAEMAKYMAKYKREEVKIQARENHEKRKEEMKTKKLEVKAERLKARVQERCAKQTGCLKETS